VPEFLSNEEIVIAARKNLNQGAWDYLVGGSESETTLRRNRLAYDRWGFRPRILVDVSKIDTSTMFLGELIRIPAILAPVGSLQVFAPEGGVAAARAAADFGTQHCVSSVTEPSWEETAAAGTKFFQLYVRGDDAWTKDAVERIAAAGYTALAITVDTAIYSRRERPMLNRWAPPTRRGPLLDRNYLSELTWDKLDRIKSWWGDRPLMVKGVATVEDALLCVDHGVEVIWVSNHGGRQLDHGLGSMDVMPEIVQAVQGKADVILDGGVQRGSDILKAVALGAKCVAIGRLQAWGLGAGGKDGCQRMLEILENEIISAMGLLGVTSIDQLSSKYVCRAEPVIPPHEMSMWTNMPKSVTGADGRIM
jgi:isopentenyl diphosphate isomerase/L-lactate dehydrogenase-like FMN-dependent dehydrogenase